jgi:hypothetical protein
MQQAEQALQMQQQQQQAPTMAQRVQHGDGGSGSDTSIVAARPQHARSTPCAQEVQVRHML